MSQERDLRRETASYLTRAGWFAGGAGAFGELWMKQENPDQQPGLAVPYHLDSESQEFQAIAWRLAQDEKRAQAVVEDAVGREFQDVQNYRIADRFAFDHSVLLDSAANVLASARRIVRAAATTSRKPRAQIGSNFSKPGDELAARARLSHTKNGSFVLPVVMPVEPPVQASDHMLVRQLVIEPSERRVTRTVATAIAALNSIAVQPSHSPRADDLMDLIQSGVSRELVSAVRAIAADSGVHAFDTTFQWAASVGTPGGLPDRVTIPDDAVELLGRVEQRLRAAKPAPDQSVSGQIVDVRYEPGDPTGEVAIKTIRNNRDVEIRITVRSQTVNSAHDWAKNGRAIVARGNVTSAPGKPLRMLDPSAVLPMDDLFIVKDMD
jgi:hypothetical protein